MWNHVDLTSSTQLRVPETTAGGERLPRCPAAVHTSNSLIRKTTDCKTENTTHFLPPEAQADDQQGSDSVIPNYLFFFFTLDPVALIISYLGLQSNLK